MPRSRPPRNPGLFRLHASAYQLGWGDRVWGEGPAPTYLHGCLCVPKAGWHWDSIFPGVPAAEGSSGRRGFTHGCGAQGKCNIFQQNRRGKSLKRSQTGLAFRYFFSLMALTKGFSSTSKTLLTPVRPMQHTAMQSCCLHWEICSVLQLQG